MYSRNHLAGVVAAVIGVGAVVAGVVVNFALQPDRPRANVVAPNHQVDVAVNNFLAVPQVQSCSPADLGKLRGKVIEVRDYQVAGPYSHGNLSVFLVHGADALHNQGPITLQEALAVNQAVVRDTGAVLSVDNLSTRPLFIQAGDVVKGGNQDRVLPYDQIIPPQTKAVPLAAYCVESGRSGPRGDEISASFEMASDFLPSRGLKLAAMLRQSQADIWAEVARLQDKLSKRVGESVQAPLSPSSLQLTLEHPRLGQPVLSYVAGLDQVIADKNDVIGCVIAINGQVQSADVYASSGLFRKFWPKLLKAAAVEALAESHPDGVAPLVSVETVKDFLSSAEQAASVSKQDIGGQTLVLRQEAPRVVLFDTCSPGTRNLVLHRTFVAK